MCRCLSTWVAAKCRDTLPYHGSEIKPCLLINCRSTGRKPPPIVWWVGKGRKTKHNNNLITGNTTGVATSNYSPPLTAGEVQSWFFASLTSGNRSKLYILKIHCSKWDADSLLDLTEFWHLFAKRFLRLSYFGPSMRVCEDVLTARFTKSCSRGEPIGIDLHLQTFWDTLEASTGSRNTMQQDDRRSLHTHHSATRTFLTWHLK